MSRINLLLERLPVLWPFHDRQDPLYRSIKVEVDAWFSALPGDRPGVFYAPDLIWPRFSLGNIDSYCFFCLDEIVLHTFYWANRQRYRSFCDVGAHMGIDAILAAKMGYDVRCFEPDPDNFSRLRQLADLNQWKGQAFNLAISDHEGASSFVQVLGNTSANHIAGQRGYYGEHREITAQTTTIDALQPFADLMKINIEGHEKVVVPLIPDDVWQGTDCFVEVHDRDNARAILDRFRDTAIAIYSQKIAWGRVGDLDDMPLSNKEGYIFISAKLAMPWPQIQDGTPPQDASTIQA